MQNKRLFVLIVGLLFLLHSCDSTETNRMHLDIATQELISCYPKSIIAFQLMATESYFFKWKSNEPPPKKLNLHSIPFGYTIEKGVRGTNVPIASFQLEPSANYVVSRCQGDVVCAQIEFVTNAQGIIIKTNANCQNLQY